MKKELIDLFFQDGYRFCKVKPEEAGVFYKYYQEGFHVVLVFAEESHCEVSKAQLEAMQNKVTELFYHPQGRLQDFPEGFPVYHVDVLTLLVTENMEHVREICGNTRGVWIYDTRKDQLIIYENQPGNFWGLRDRIESINQINGNQDAQTRQYTASRETDRRQKGQLQTAVAKIKQLPFITIMIAAVNVLVYLILSFGGDTENAMYMAEHGAMYPDFLLYNSQWWRIITAMFLHFGVTHLMNNMVIFCCVGSRLEKVIGHIKYLILYFMAGIGGGIFSYLMMVKTGDYAVSAGASGAVFGVIGGLLWVVILHRGNLEGLTTRGLIMMLVLSLYFGFSTAGVDNWCHIGGMVCGFLAAIILCHRKRQNH